MQVGFLLQVWGKLTVDSIQGIHLLCVCVCVLGPGVSLLLRLEALQKQSPGEICGTEQQPLSQG